MDKLLVVFVVLSSLEYYGYASICKPYSYFTMDCNTCSCDRSGKEYSCTRFICPVKTYEERFIIDKTEDGHTLLKPRPRKEQGIDINDGEYMFVGSTIHSRKIRVSPKFRYTDDEVPSSGSDTYSDEIANHMDNHIEERNGKGYIWSHDEEMFTDDENSQDSSSVDAWNKKIPHRSYKKRDLKT
ncbi:unnamed protein product [Acanthoscelides obtectus]|uniref:Pacifastin domain-containing protein n=2 Tax=Acanthoscelides obtectus TaxID=200917 RepID=A0A9P0M5R4_ACAOB|nr:unnamed protein product [Acanthoscelides obtectus]CAK1671804.1 hypothetical protein AOBTE_LOCUS28472 [Acanthoscelides obtectus]